ncbi:seipin-3-like isoform X1 [Rosa rugosa]|uniref:seipin-3-like isoform X1 n=1 Tax=Rosa rugosa TaxID=74645 RepID=UPI002B415FB3|nr:seipin-3-like isoform X1 [Rosa rugosa]
MVLLIKTIGFQVSLVVKFFTFPIWLFYFSFMLLLCPFQTLRHIRGYLMTMLLRLWSATFTNFTSAVCGGFKTQNSLAVKVGFALFRSIHVCCMLLGILASGFVLSGFVMKHLVEKPIKTIETLNFDYTKTSPVALVPLMSSSVGVIPYGHKLRMIVSLTVPDSEYNHRLGVFQVRVEFLSANGDVTASSSHPCMLQFKSRPIQYIQTFLRSTPLIAGLQSETQVLNIKINEHAEGLEPTTRLKVILEQRAEFHHGEGIPQSYAGSLLLESELPQLKRFVWCWRRTIFVWTSIGSFLAELVFILVFFRPMLVPRGRPEMSSGNTRRSNIIFRHKSR